VDSTSDRDSTEGPASQAPLVCFVTASVEAEARRIARALVEERHAACVNVVTGVRSIYRWRGSVEESDEVLLVVKTTRGRFDGLAVRVRELHSYETPEIVACGIEAGDAAYIAWLTDAVADR
jgi:periplasmic divalent cation tolerance protein